MAQVPGSEQFFPADLVLLSMGFVGPEAQNLEVKRDGRGTIETKKDASSIYEIEDGLFAAGDCRRGQSLIVWGIQEGRQCARAVDQHLMHSSRLPANGSIEKRDYLLLDSLHKPEEPNGKPVEVSV